MIFKLMYQIDLNVLNLMVCLTLHIVYTLSTEFNPLIFHTLALKNILGHVRNLWRIYFHALHQDYILFVGWVV